jgi:thiamine biosynthesis lipoprotein
LRLLLTMVFLVSSLLTCTERSPNRYDTEFLAMGTRVQLSLLARTPTEAAQLSAHLQRRLLRQGIDWYPWSRDPSGELRQLNAALAAGKPITISQPLRALLQRALQAYQFSDGYFDPAVAPLTAAWGFADVAGHAGIPDPALLEHWRQARPTLADLHIDGEQVSSVRHDLQLDLGAIGKGYALQLALQELQRQGCTDAALNMGGQLGIMGAQIAQQLGPVAIRDPRADTALATLQLAAGESISTSGDYERYALVGQQRIHHLFDPHTGLPVTHTEAVTVISMDATLADAASTALMAAGPDNWQRIARQLGVRDVLRVDASGAIEVTAALYARLKWRHDLPPHRIHTVEP